MIPIKLASRCISKSAASLVRSPQSFSGNGARFRITSTLRPEEAMPLPSWSISQRLAYSTENTLSKSDPMENKSESQPQAPPPLDSSSESVREQPSKPLMKKSKKSEEDSSGSQNVLMSSTENSSVEEKNKIFIDNLFKTIELEVLSYEPSVLDSYQWFVVNAATQLGITVGKCWSPLKSDKKRFPLLKSAFVHKKHQVHYEIRTYHRFLTFHKLTGSTKDTFLEYIQRNLPEGVGMKVTKVEVKPLPDYLQKQ